MPGSFYIGTDDPKTVKLFSAYIANNVPKSNIVFNPRYGLAGKGDDNVFIREDSMEKGAADQITHYFSHILPGDGVYGTETIEGKEAAQEIVSDTFKIDKTRHGIRIQNDMTQQRIKIDLGKDGATVLRKWAAERQQIAVFLHLAGTTATSTSTYKDSSGTTIKPEKLVWTGSNTPRAPDDEAILRSGGVADDASLTSSHLFTTELLDQAHELLVTRDHPAEPISLNGEPVWPVLVHTSQETQCYDTSSNFQQIATYALQGGYGKMNPLLSAARFRYRNFLIIAHPHMPPGENAGSFVANTRRAVVLGKRALMYGFGRGYGQSGGYKTTFSATDGGEALMMYLGFNWGCRVPMFRERDTSTLRRTGSLVLSTYAAGVI